MVNWQMAYLSNSELLISDDSIGNLLNTLEKDAEFERLMSTYHESVVRPVFAEKQEPMPPVQVARPATGVPLNTVSPKRRRRNPAIIILASLVLFLVATPMLLYRPVISKYRQPPIGSESVSQNLEMQDETIGSFVEEKHGTQPSSLFAAKGYTYDLLFAFESSDLEQCQTLLDCPVVIEENRIRIETDKSESELLSVLKSELDSMVSALNETPAFINIKSASADETYAEYSIVVTAVNLNTMEREAIRELFAPSSLYNCISHSEAKSIRVNFYNMLGDVVNYMDSIEF